MIVKAGQLLSIIDALIYSLETAKPLLDEEIDTKFAQHALDNLKCMHEVAITQTNSLINLSQISSQVLQSFVLFCNTKSWHRQNNDPLNVAPVVAELHKICSDNVTFMELFLDSVIADTRVAQPGRLLINLRRSLNSNVLSHIFGVDKFASLIADKLSNFVNEIITTSSLTVIQGQILLVPDLQDFIKPEYLEMLIADETGQYRSIQAIIATPAVSVAKISDFGTNELIASIAQWCLRNKTYLEKKSKLRYAYTHYDYDESHKVQQQKVALFSACDLLMNNSLPQFRSLIIDGTIDPAFAMEFLTAVPSREQKLFAHCSSELLQGFITSCYQLLKKGCDHDTTKKIIQKIGMLVTDHASSSKDEYKKLLSAIALYIVEYCASHDEMQEYFARMAILFLDMLHDVNIVDEKGRTPLHLALARGYSYNETLVNFLLANNAKIDVADDSGETALSLAAAIGSEYQNPQLVRKMLSGNASISIPVLERALIKIVDSYYISLKATAVFNTFIARLSAYPDWNRAAFIATNVKWCCGCYERAIRNPLDCMQAISVPIFAVFDAIAKLNPTDLVPCLTNFIIDKRVCDLAAEDNAYNVFYYLAQHPEICQQLNAKTNEVISALKKRYNLEGYIGDNYAANLNILALAVSMQTGTSACPLALSKATGNMQYMLLMLNVFIPNLRSNFDSRIQNKMRDTLFSMLDDGVGLQPIIASLQAYTSSKLVLNIFSFRRKLLSDILSKIAPKSTAAAPASKGLLFSDGSNPNLAGHVKKDPDQDDGNPSSFSTADLKL